MFLTGIVVLLVLVVVGWIALEFVRDRAYERASRQVSQKHWTQKEKR